uniref:ATP synthase epsilon chain, chloroplastic n=1 Tax=Nephroselmis olivacea TaxID=31312 RepID=ATPE_NEPOL|nr:ATP synthase CF1 epsilon subunit [Nephroselmis olivacea]Q9TL33.1 RecName: Full=ATP synthase epsilon chain, chloroplastic; AltName: Full=ATP synthase F1 sector epsilon subunit; AltName: Full=F-ATPase epsilon subunit [Nephroselmis olivacea]AAD54783.1 CF1 epsilon subunit of ATP synthase [Nephroselmis olivacea]
MSLQVRILTPEQVFLNVSADEIILPTNTGQMGVLTNHTPLITAIDIGPMLVRSESTWQSMALLGGLALVKDNQVIILVNEAELGSDINAEEAETTFLAAKEALANSKTRKDQIENNLAFKRARVRYQVATLVK